MRVLILIEEGSRSRYWRDSVLEMARLGVEPHLATVRSRGPLHSELEDENISVSSLDCRDKRDYPRAIHRLKSFLIEEPFDVLHLSEPIAALIGGLAGKLVGHHGRIFHRHHTVLEHSGFVPRLSSRLTDLTMCVSVAVATQVKSEHRPRWQPRTRVVHNGIKPLNPPSPLHLAALRRSLGIADGDSVITIVGRLRPEKGHRTLFQSSPLIASRLTTGELHVIVVGSGSEHATLRQYAQSIEGGRIHFVGHADDVAAYYSVADIVAIPSLREPFGLVALEAMSCKRPIVASRTGGLEEILTPQTAQLVAPDDPRELAEAALQLLMDRSLRATMASIAYDRFKNNFLLDRMVAGWRAQYEELQHSQ